MTFKVLADAVDEKLAAIALVLAQAEQGDGMVDLPKLARHLMDAMRLFQRNPGIRAAADDLYVATAALVADSRLTGAAERVGPYEYLVVPVFPMHQAA